MYADNEGSHARTYVPIRSAPAVNMSLHASKVRTPPDAFTFTVPLYSTDRYIRLTSSVVAPVPDAKPVDVLTNAAPASAASTQAATLRSELGMRPVSRITLTGTSEAAWTIVRRCTNIWAN